MTKQEVRIKCLELSNRLDLSAEAVIARAKLLEEWIVQDPLERPVEKNEKPAQVRAPVKKGIGNADILS